MKIIKYFFEALIIYLFFLIIKILGLKNSRKIFSFIFIKVGPLIKSKKIVEENIFRVFGNQIDSKQITKSMANLMWHYITKHIKCVLYGSITVNSS